jgi:hypothetical protein
MKKTILAIIALATSSSLSFAALYTLNNGTGSTASGIQTSTGATFRAGTTAGDAFATGGGTSAGPGIVAFGIFSTDTLTGLTASQLIAAFTPFGTPGAFAATGTTGNRSVFSSAQNVTVAGSSFDLKNMYLFVGNGTTFAGSTEFLVAKSTLTFNSGDDSATAPIVQTIRPSNSTVLFGALATSVQTANTDGSATPGWTTAAIPEPSATILGVVGALSILRRRRN